MSEGLGELKCRRHFVPNLINGSQGAAVLAAMNVLSSGKSYQEPKDWPGNTLVILEYGGYTSMVSFMETGEGVISGQASLAKEGQGISTAQMLQMLGLSEGDLKPLPSGTP